MIAAQPFVPEVWGKDNGKMWHDEEIDDPAAAEFGWLSARDAMIHWVRYLQKLGVHRQRSNRLLEPFGWADWIVSSTEFENFFKQRAVFNASPEIQHLAEKMQWLYREATPRPLEEGEWHIPYDEPNLPLETRLKVATARIARVTNSYHDMTHDIELDIKLHDRLKSYPHPSPFEHIAFASEGPHRNFHGFTQYRELLGF